MTTYLEDWLARVQELGETFGKQLLSPAEFEDRLAKITNAAGSPFSAITVELNPGAGRSVSLIGAPGTGDESDLKTLQLGETTTAKVRAWSGSAQAGTDEAGIIAVRSLIEAWWRTADRDGMTGLLQSSRTGMLDALASSLAAWSNDDSCPLAFGDVDRFKQLNDQLGQTEGDRAIAQVAGFIADLSPRDGIVLRRGGDEFLLALPPRPVNQLVNELTELRTKVEQRLQQAYPNLQGDPLGFSMGVAMVNEGDLGAAGWDERSERTMKPNGIKQRGRVSFETDSKFLGFREDATRISIEATRARLGEPSPFANVWLRWLSAIAESTAVDEGARSHVDRAVLTINPNWADSAVGRAVSVDGTEFDGSRELAALDLALSIAHGTARGLGERADLTPVDLTFSLDGSYAQVSAGESVLFEHGSPGEIVNTIRFPRMPDAPTNINARRLIAISIGERTRTLRPYFYADQIFLDDRPTRGGGLPDFWEAALAQVIDSLQKHPNVHGIVIDGDPSNGTQTMKWLQAEWSDDNLTYLSAKLNVPPHVLTTARGRLNGAVHWLEPGVDEIDIVSSAQSCSGPLIEGPSHMLPVGRPRLQRRLVADQFLLGQQDGCRVHTASDAYPIALDIVRQADAALHDSQRRPFSELTDFRIQLTDPTEDPIARYYLADKDSLEEYFQREFLRSGGKFFDALAVNEQYEHVLAHLSSCIAEGVYASRRAVLVLPHIPTSSDVSPLGLVSVRAIPRLEADESVRVDYSFTWRTVEAIVGLPYSLFGSIRFAEEITRTVAEKIAHSGPKLAIGQLSYIAHSLHMYNDGYGANVARRIVNDESL